LLLCSCGDLSKHLAAVTSFRKGLNQFCGQGIEVGGEGKEKDISRKAKTEAEGKEGKREK
jgi:hypothetical protein